ncbi:TerD family protein [Umezawaea tangerina]|uniref:TerD domain-containing protein n=1 Tax=Umezawaea tangerina TaxID=84725 RepID=A0A2T0SPR1_9PSEU|nr:TerD family protein [Umezawaea tangerina]PRY35386.1 hypothetical protein CLV43_114304 [Umezawaea tangerina]
MLEKLIIQKTLRVPAVAGATGDATSVSRQLDVVLMSAGFKASGPLLEHLSRLEPGTAMDAAVRVLGAVRELVGDHVAHNVYFRDFPRGVPDTLEFWASCLRDALVGSRVGGDGGVPSDEQLLAAAASGGINLLALPRYGTYQHTYEEMLAAHADLISDAKDRVTVLHLGGTLAEETTALYLQLAGSTVPLGEAELALLEQLARECVDGDQPTTIPVRENRAVVNGVRLASGRELVAVDTVTDVLRLACQFSGGDVSLAEPTRFRSFGRPQRRALMAALETVVAANPDKLGDVRRYRQRWKSLSSGVHPHEFRRYPHAQDVFAVARGDLAARSLAGRVELAFAAGDVGRAVERLAMAPGMLLRQLDRVLRSCGPDETDMVIRTLQSVANRVSGRVLCSVREHLGNRTAPDTARVFANRSARSWVTTDERPPLDAAVVARVVALLDDELAHRVPLSHDRLVVDPAVLQVALPLSGKASADGFGVMPRGSLASVDGEVLRFFCYWKQTMQRTDFDLSALLLNEDFDYLGHVSWTSLSFDGAVSSGDITDATNGATEFIDVPLRAISAHYVVPQVNIYAGEGFDEVAESLFGFMTRARGQQGSPFEAKTVRSRSEMRGNGRVALPLVFIRNADFTWSAKWLHLYLQGGVNFNRVETNRLSTALQARGIVERRYLQVQYVVDLMSREATSVTEYTPGMAFDEPVTFVGLERPEHLPEGSQVFTLDTLRELVPQ